MNYKDIIDSLLTQLKMIQKTNTLSAASNLYGRHGILAGICKNKLILREEVLANSKGGTGSEFTKQCLKGSSFFTPDLFGPVPESLLKSIIHNPAYTLKCSSISSARSYMSYNNSVLAVPSTSTTPSASIPKSNAFAPLASTSKSARSSNTRYSNNNNRGRGKGFQRFRNQKQEPKK